MQYKNGRGDKDGIMDDFLLGLIESTKEIGSPFFTEAIWTEALQDVAPVLGRNGTTPVKVEKFGIMKTAQVIKCLKL